MLEFNAEASKKVIWYILNTTINSKMLGSKILENYPSVFLELVKMYPNIIRSINEDASLTEIINEPVIPTDNSKTSKNKIYPPYSKEETEYIKILSIMYSDYDTIKEKCNMIFNNDRTKNAIVTKLHKIRNGK